MIWLARKWKNFRERGKPASAATHDFKFGMLDPLLERAFGSESWWLKFAGLPLGSSILLVLRKKAGDGRPGAHDSAAGAALASATRS
jgi:hypothetical protein